MQIRHMISSKTYGKLMALADEGKNKPYSKGKRQQKTNTQSKRSPKKDSK